LLLNTISCKKPDDSIEDNPKIGIVSQNTADAIAKKFPQMYYGLNENREIESQVAAIENDVPLFYVYNYKGGGFLILSAEYGETPILANNITGNFPLKGEISPGIGVWFNQVKNHTLAIKEGKLKPENISGILWAELESGTFNANLKYVIKDDLLNGKSKLNTRGNGNPYAGYGVPKCRLLNSVQIGPLMTTLWDQLCFYNAQVPVSGSFCNKGPTGCVATTMAQILKYHSQPANLFNFSNMPNSLTSSNADVAEIMRNCGNLVNMSWGANSSGANTENMVGALEGLGYSTDAVYDEWSPSQHIQNINLARPVVLRGCTDSSCFLWWCWGSGSCHAWVSDGFQQVESDCYGRNWTWSMNWGWGGQSNGFYAGFAPDPTLPFIYYNKMIRDIHFN
jgi:hypothetical protein